MNSIASCPTSDATWSAVTTLLPTPYSRLCTCMTNSLSCIANSTITDRLSNQQFADYFMVIRNDKDTGCLGIGANGSTGVYGAYSVCSTTEMFSWATNQYYMSNNKASSSCDLNGSLIIRNPVTPLDTDCELLLAQAGAVGTQTITPTPPATGTATSTSRNLITQGASGASGTTPAYKFEQLFIGRPAFQRRQS